MKWTYVLGYVLVIVLLFSLAGCGKSEPTGNATKNENPAPKEAKPVEAAKPADTKPAEAPKDAERVGIEAAGLFEAKYCNYKVAAVQLQLNDKNNALKLLKDQQEKDGGTGLKDEIAKASQEVSGLEKELEGLKDTCKQPQFGDKCDGFKKDVESNVKVMQGELKDDQASLKNWEAKLEAAKASSNLMDITIAKAKVDKLKSRAQKGENQVNAFTTMLEDLKRFC